MGTTIQITAATGTTATVKVTRLATAVVTDGVDIMPVIDNSVDGKSVGDTLTAFMQEGWVADTYGFQWKNNGVNIGGATTRNYVLAPNDLGDNITVAVTGAISGQAVPAPVTSSIWGPITAGTITGTGTIGITGTLKIGVTLFANSTYTAMTSMAPSRRPRHTSGSVPGWRSPVRRPTATRCSPPISASRSR